MSARCIRRRPFRTAGLAAGLLLCSLLVISYTHAAHQQHQYEQKLQHNNTRLQSLTHRLQTVQKAKAGTDSELQQKAQAEQTLQAQIQDLQGQLQAKREQQSLIARAANAVTLTATASAASYGDDGSAKAFIYSHESGNVPCKINGGGIDCYYTGSLACGLGQALPCSKLRAVCPDLSDYACQDAWFTNDYMIPRYGTWENAKAYWQQHSWW